MECGSGSSDGLPYAFATALQGAPLAVAAYEGVDHVCIFANALHDAAFGTLASVGIPFRETFESRHVPLLRACLDSVWLTGQVSQHQVTMPPPGDDGRVIARHYRYQLAPWFDADGAVKGVVSYVEDETDRIAAETENVVLTRRLLESEQRMRRVFDAAPANIGVHEGPDHVCIYSNPLRTRLIGFDPIGKSVRDAVAPFGGQSLLDDFDTVYRTGEAIERQELPIEFTRNGVTGFYYIARLITPWFNDAGRIGGVMSISLNITDQVRGREQARRAQIQLRELIDGLPIFVAMLDRDGHVKQTNRPVLEHCSLKRDEIVGKAIWDVNVWSSEHASQIRRAVEHAMHGQTVRFDAPVNFPQDGEAVVDLQFVPLRNEHNEISEIVWSATNITDRVHAETLRQVLVRELQHRVKNTLATVQSVLRFSARTAETKNELVEAMQNRLVAISRSHESLVASNWKGQSLRALIEAEVAPYTEFGSNRFTYTGPDLQLSPTTALHVELGFHELATNAAKYGAFSTASGRVSVTVAHGAGATNMIEWRELGGPAVAPPGKQGFGSFLLREVLPLELDAELQMDYDPSGLLYRLTWRDDARNGI